MQSCGSHFTPSFFHSCVCYCQLQSTEVQIWILIQQDNVLNFRRNPVSLVSLFVFLLKDFTCGGAVGLGPSRFSCSSRKSVGEIVSEVFICFKRHDNNSFANPNYYTRINNWITRSSILLFYRLCRVLATTMLLALQTIIMYYDRLHQIIIIILLLILFSDWVVV